MRSLRCRIGVAVSADVLAGGFGAGATPLVGVVLVERWVMGFVPCDHALGAGGFLDRGGQHCDWCRWTSTRAPRLPARYQTTRREREVAGGRDRSVALCFHVTGWASHGASGAISPLGGVDGAGGLARCVNGFGRRGHVQFRARVGGGRGQSIGSAGGGRGGGGHGGTGRRRALRRAPWTERDGAGTGRRRRRDDDDETATRTRRTRARRAGGSAGALGGHARATDSRSRAAESQTADGRGVGGAAVESCQPAAVVRCSAKGGSAPFETRRRAGGS